MTYTPPKVRRLPPRKHRNFYVRNASSPKPGVLLVIHMTGNPRTAADANGIANGSGAYDEWAYASGHPEAADGPSAHDYVARDGSYIEYLDPAKYAAWSNGDFIRPQLHIPGVKYLWDMRRRGFNANQLCYRETENVAYPVSHWLTAEQRETNAYFAAVDSITTDIPIVPFKTVLTHAWINWVNRQNCAFSPKERDAAIRAICVRANQIKRELLGQKPAPRPTPKPTPAPAPTGGQDVATKGYDPANPQIVTVKAGAEMFERIGGPVVANASAPPALNGRDWLGMSADGGYTLVSSGGGVSIGSKWVRTSDTSDRRPKAPPKPSQQQLDAVRREGFVAGRDAAVKAGAGVQP